MARVAAEAARRLALLLERRGLGVATRPATRLRRLAWAELLRRVFAVDVLACPRCGGRMRLLAAIHPPEATHAILAYLALPARAPPLRAARFDEVFEEAPSPPFDVEAEFGA